MSEKNILYKEFIEDNLKIVNKESQVVPFILNSIQNRYLLEDSTNNDIILKARQQGFSSLVLAMFGADFIVKENQRNVIVADNTDNAQELLDRVKFFIKSFEDKVQNKLPLKYNSKYELFNEATNSRYTIGTADNTDFGRSKTITNLHLSECFFYPNFEKILASALQAVVPTGRVIFETTANGFNYGKTFWEECKTGERPYKPLFYKASDFYDKEFLDKKKRELGRFFPQEYPETDTEAFLTSGEMYFNSEALKYYLDNSKEPIKEDLIFV
jgi:hypothetical protein